MKKNSLESSKSYTLSGSLAPILTVKPGELFSLSADDAVSGAITTEKDPFTSKTLEPFSLVTPELANPVTGPVFIEGVHKGDLLAVHIENIIPNSYGVTGIKVNQGMFHDSKKWKNIFKEPHTKLLMHTDGPSGTKEDGEVHYSDSLKWAAAPFIGTIGVAPEVEVVATSITQGPWGGNWDCRFICPGSTIYINAFHAGGLLFVGDVHGSQGDGELSGIANEIKATVRLGVDIIKNKKIPYPRIETDEYLIAFCSTKPLEDAIENATSYMLDWLTTEYDIDARTAYIVFSTCPDFRIDVYQMVRMTGISYTAGVRLPKKYLQSMVTANR